LTKPVAKSHLDGFFAKVHTPVAPSPEEDENAVRDARAHPERIEARKLRPGSNWEFMKPGRADVLGFGGTWVLVGVILALLWLMISIK